MTSASCATSADRTVVMYQGRVVEQGTTEQIFTPPQKEAYTRKLIASTPEMRTDWLDEVLRERGDLFDIDAKAPRLRIRTGHRGRPLPSPGHGIRNRPPAPRVSPWDNPRIP